MIGPDQIPVWLIVCFVLILLVQSTCLFIHARRHNQKWYWFWGLYGLIQFPFPTLLYLLFVIKPWKKKN